MPYSLIVGLGNPGQEYDSTRHNVGFCVVDAFANESSAKWTLDKKHKANVAQVRFGSANVILAKPTTFMNESGTAVAKLCGYYRIPQGKVIVIYDDIAFKIGNFRINDREGSGGHNGVKDILSKIGGGFVRYRIGVRGERSERFELKDYVLSKLSQDELNILKNKMPEILLYLKLLLDKGVEHAMNLANREKFYE